ncbi:MAG: DUF2808 domain-containing protein [Iphinoe sp. HA4291-MV1]|jgi:hypothetical protein|nr:DUF2808 domain-containing protein [Iphinoe sp. HA4291-MV1]
MKRTLISTAVCSVATAASIFTGYANAKTDDRVPNVNKNVVFPSTSWRIVKHTFQLHVPQNNNALSELVIDVPSTVAVSNDIDVLDEKGQKININVSVNGRRITIDFPEPIISKTKLLIEFNKVKQPILGSASVYSLSVKVVGSDVEIPVGVARFPTSIDSEDKH